MTKRTMSDERSFELGIKSERKRILDILVKCKHRIYRGWCLGCHLKDEIKRGTD